MFKLFGCRSSRNRNTTGTQTPPNVVIRTTEQVQEQEQTIEPQTVVPIPADQLARQQLVIAKYNERMKKRMEDNPVDGMPRNKLVI